MNPIPVETFFELADKLKKHNAVDLITNVFDNVEQESIESYYYCIIQLLHNKQKFNSFLYKCYVKVITQVMCNIVDNYDPELFSQKINARKIDIKPVNTLLTGLINVLKCRNHEIETIDDYTIINDIIDTMDIDDLIDYIRVLSIKENNSDNLEVTAAIVAKQLDNKYPKLFEFHGYLLDRPIKMMNIPEWYRCFENLVKKIITHEQK